MARTGRFVTKMVKGPRGGLKPVRIWQDDVVPSRAQVRAQALKNMRNHAHALAMAHRRDPRSITTIGWGTPRLAPGNMNMLTPVRKADMMPGETALDARYRMNADHLKEQREQLRNIQRAQERAEWEREAVEEQRRQLARRVPSKLMKRSNAMGPYSYTSKFIGPRPKSYWQEGSSAESPIIL